MSEALPPKNKKQKYLIIGVVLVVACGLAAYLRFVYFSPQARVHRNFKRIEAAMDPEAMRLWAADLAGVHPKGAYIIKQDVLKTLSTLAKQQPSVSIGSGDAKGSAPYAIVSWSGSPSWGILVGATNFHLPPGSKEFHDVKWVDGIYFRHEGSR